MEEKFREFKMNKEDVLRNTPVYAIKGSWQNFGDLWRCEKDDGSTFFSGIDEKELLNLNDWSACWVSHSEEEAWRQENDILEDVPVEDFDSDWKEHVIRVNTKGTHLVHDIEYWYTRSLILSPEKR